MDELSFELVGWIASTYGDEEIRATMGSLRISAGKEDRLVPITDVEDIIGKRIGFGTSGSRTAVAEGHAFGERDEEAPPSRCRPA